MPAATWCARNSMVTSKNRDFMQGANSIEKVSNSRDASSNMVRQKQHGHKQKQGLHTGANSNKNVGNIRVDSSSIERQHEYQQGRLQQQANTSTSNNNKDASKNREANNRRQQQLGSQQQRGHQRQVERVSYRKKEVKRCWSEGLRPL
jgi:hypothetical protein